MSEPELDNIIANAMGGTGRLSVSGARRLADAAYRAGIAAGMERAAQMADRLAKPAHTYASENADHYRGFDAGAAQCADAIRSAVNPKDDDA
jgi:hypothetical protein